MKVPDEYLSIDKNKNNETKIVDEDFDLQGLLKLTYNFEKLKGIIISLLKNQKSLQQQIDKSNEKYSALKRSIGFIKEDINSIKEEYSSKIDNLHKKEYLPKEEFNSFQIEIKKNISYLEKIYKLNEGYKLQKKESKVKENNNDNNDDNNQVQNQDIQKLYGLILQNREIFNEYKNINELQMRKKNEEELIYRKNISNKLEEFDCKFQFVIGEENMDVVEKVVKDFQKSKERVQGGKGEKRISFSKLIEGEKEKQLKGITSINDIGKQIEKLNLVKMDKNKFKDKFNIIKEKTDTIEKNLSNFLQKEDFEKVNKEMFDRANEDIKKLNILFLEKSSKLDEKLSYIEKHQNEIPFLIKKLKDTSILAQFLQDKLKDLLVLLIEQEKENHKLPQANYNTSYRASSFDMKYSTDSWNWVNSQNKDMNKGNERYYRQGDGFSRLLQMVEVKKDINATKSFQTSSIENFKKLKISNFKSNKFSTLEVNERKKNETKKNEMISNEIKKNFIEFSRNAARSKTRNLSRKI